MERKVTHDTFRIERQYDATPTRVFAAFAAKEAKSQWFVGPAEWKKSDHRLDFKVGGKEHLSGGPVGQPQHHYDATFMDIVPNERIITTYEMHIGDQRISVSVATVELKPAGKGTRFVLIEQGAYLDGFDTPKLREEGTSVLMNQLGDWLKKSA
ncbi:MAG TPA: SRPBCC family protein [Dongiaceae bacterium]